MQPELVPEAAAEPELQAQHQPNSQSFKQLLAMHKAIMHSDAMHSDAVHSDAMHRDAMHNLNQQHTQIRSTCKSQQSVANQ